MDDKRRNRNLVASGATLFSSKRLKKSTDKSENTPKKNYKVSGAALNQDILPIYHSAPDPGWEDKVIDVLGRSGVEVGSYKKRYLIRRIRVRMGRLKLNSYQDYFKYLNDTKGEIKDLQESLSINVTRFFRNRDTYDLLKKEILPQLVDKCKKNKQKDIKIWSAGCAVGAEPYTLAMICSDAIPMNIKLSIQATDIKNDLLSVARNGVYSEAYLAELTETEAMKYFSNNRIGEYAVNQNIKRLVTFSRHDLMKDKYPNYLDMITCRNVLIYVDRTAQQEIITNFFNALKPGGILILGRTETLFGDWRRHVDIISTKHRIYQKKSTNKNETIKVKKKKVIRPLVSKISTKDHKNRLSDLKNFKETYQKRRKVWNKELDQKVGDQKKKIKPEKSYRKNLSPKKTIKRTMKSTDKPLETKKKTQAQIRSGSLSNYRKQLISTTEPQRISQVRKDLKSAADRLSKITKASKEKPNKYLDRKKKTKSEK